MLSNNKAFTLIELLVVVLIVGILAAVAVPQYQKAVEKSRATQLYVLLSAISRAQHVYYLANNVWAQHFSELDVELPFTDDTEVERYFTGAGYQWKKWIDYSGLAGCRNYRDGMYCLQVSFVHGGFSCCGTKDTQAISLCQSLGFSSWYADSGIMALGDTRTGAMKCYCPMAH